MKWQMDRSYKMKTLLLDEVKADESYEIVITSFHGGSLVRYRIGDMIRITSLRNDKLGISIPQMSFERRVDDLIDFYVVMLTEKKIWQAIENTGVAYEDWIAFRDAENLLLNISIEIKDGYQANPEQIAKLLFSQLTQTENSKSETPSYDNNLMDIADFGIKVNILPRGTFDNYIARRQAEGADLAHLKPPHINPSEKVLSMLITDTKETIVVTRSGVKTQKESDNQKVSVS
jgi:hypothetical protein